MGNTLRKTLLLIAKKRKSRGSLEELIKELVKNDIVEDEEEAYQVVLNLNVVGYLKLKDNTWRLTKLVKNNKFSEKASNAFVN